MRVVVGPVARLVEVAWLLQHQQDASVEPPVNPPAQHNLHLQALNFRIHLPLAEHF